MNRKPITCLRLLVLCCVAALLSPVPLSAQKEPAKTAERAPIVLGPDDSIHVLALNCEEISKEWRIGQTGDVNFPLIGRIRLAGLTLEEAEQVISKQLKRYLKDPQVTVYAGEVRSSPVTVAGAVDKPGRYQISSGSTLFAVLIQAGGPKNSGSTVTVKRSLARGNLTGPNVRIDGGGEFALAEFDMKTVLDGPEGPGSNGNFKLEPFDIVTVAPAAAGRFVHITGEVTRPSHVELVTQESVSLMKLIAMAGGLTRTASASKTMIIHVTDDGVQTSTSVVDVKKIMDGKSKDLDLTAGDVVMVPTSKTKTVTTMLTATAITAGLTAAIYSLIHY